MEENKTWFQSKHLPDWSINHNAIEKMAMVTRGYKRMGFNVRNHQWEMSYDSYKAAQAEAHRVYGCNLKRALRKFGVKNRVRHKTRNDRWVWMK